MTDTRVNLDIAFLSSELVLILSNSIRFTVHKDNLRSIQATSDVARRQPRTSPCVVDHSRSLDCAQRCTRGSIFSAWRRARCGCRQPKARPPQLQAVVNHAPTDIQEMRHPPPSRRLCPRAIHRERDGRRGAAAVRVGLAVCACPRDGCDAQRSRAISLTGTPLSRSQTPPPHPDHALPWPPIGHTAAADGRRWRGVWPQICRGGGANPPTFHASRG